MASLVDLSSEACSRLLRRSVLGRPAIVVPPGRTELLPVDDVASGQELTGRRLGPPVAAGRASWGVVR